MSYFKELWRLVKLAGARPPGRCPKCGRWLTVIALHGPSYTVYCRDENCPNHTPFEKEAH